MNFDFNKKIINYCTVKDLKLILKHVKNTTLSYSNFELFESLLFYVKFKIYKRKVLKLVLQRSWNKFRNHEKSFQNMSGLQIKTLLYNKFYSVSYLQSLSVNKIF